MKVNKELALRDYTIGKEIFEVYMYLLVSNSNTLSLTQIRKDLGLKVKDVKSRNNRDYIIKALSKLKKKGYLQYNYFEDKLNVELKEPEDFIELPDVLHNYFLTNKLTSIEKRLLFLLLTEDTSKDRYTVYKKADIKDRAGKLNIKKMFNKGVFYFKSRKELTQRLRMICKDGNRPIKFVNSIVKNIK